MSSSPNHFPSLDARCPACGQESLYRGFQGRVSCATDDCPNPAAVHNLLNDPNLTAHLVAVTQEGRGFRWTLRHPLIERLGDALFACELAQYMGSQQASNPDLTPGVYRVDVSPRGRVWHLTPVGVEIIDA